MGCVPSERKVSSTAASIAVKKNPSLRQLDSKSKTSSNSLENNNLKPPSQRNSPTFRSPKQIPKRNSEASSPKSKNQLSSSSKQTYVYNHNSNSPNRKVQTQTVRVLAPKCNPTSDPKAENLSKLASIHSLDIHSRIKQPQSGKNMTLNIERKEPGRQQNQEEEINITFNNNNFLTANSRDNSRITGLGMGKRWREETLREELRAMNEEHFRKIHVDSMNFN